eukprot:GSChrysophyteH2.ASY1.ANO1.1381.1 assembled CDS
MRSSILSHNNKFHNFETNSKCALPLSLPLSLHLVALDRTNPLHFPPTPGPKMIPFETDLFKGVAFFTHKHASMDEKYQCFYDTKKKVTYEVQVQGKFKRLPRGELVCGAETCEKMELGFMTRTFCNMTLKFAGTIVDDLHYSFGEDLAKSDHEFPHLVGPLFPTLDKIIESKPGDPLPEMGRPFLEDPEYRKKRLKWKSSYNANINLDYTYSFSVNTANIDIVAWQFVNIPMVNNIDLSSIFGDSPMRLICYEIPDDVVKAYKTHPQKYLKYVFNIKLTRNDPNNPAPAESDAEIDGSDMDLEENETDDTEEEQEEEKMSSNQYLSFDDVSGGGGVHKGFMKNLFSGLAKNVPMPSLIDIPDTAGDYLLPSFENENQDALNYCPAIMEVFDCKKKDMNIMYLLPYTDNSGGSKEGKAGGRPPKTQLLRLRSYEEVAKKLTMEPIPKLHKNKIMVTIEKKRRQIVESYRCATKTSIFSVAALLGDENEADAQFLTHNAKSFKLLSLNRPNKQHAKRDLEKLWAGSVALALGNRHWIEYYLIITPEGAGISLHQGNKEMWIPLSSMVRARAMKSSEVPFHGFSFLLLETLRKVYYLMVKDEQVLAAVLAALSALGVTEQVTVDRTLGLIDDVFPQLIFKSRMETWKLTKRRLYNCRRLLFSTADVPPPNELVESLLSKALNLADAWTMRSALDRDRGQENDVELIVQWMDFLDELGGLQVLNLQILNESERAAFFLNLYHVMVIHGALVLFPPQTSSNWQPFFHDVAYLVSFNVISIAEIEHNILRSSMSSMPRLALGLDRSRVAPRSSFPGLALTHRDFRFHFCMNTGSISMPGKVCIYHAHTLDAQLDEMTALAVSSAVQVDARKRVVTLPIVCSWYPADFVARGMPAAPVDCIRALTAYCNNMNREQLSELLLSGMKPHIKYKPFTFKSRLLTRYSAGDDGDGSGKRIS